MSRILFVTEKYFPQIGGLARSGQRIAQTLTELGNQVEVFALSSQLDSGQARSESVSDGLTVHHFGRSKQIDFTLQQAMIFLEWLHGRNAETSPFDLVWSHYAMSNGYFGIWFAKHFGLKSVLSVRGNDVDRQFLPPGDLSRLDWSLRNASQVVSVSKDLAAKVKTISDVESVVLPNSVDATLFCLGTASQSLREKYDISPEQLVLVFSGELRAKKGLAMLIECYRQLAIKRPTKLLIIGDVRAKELGRFQKHTAELSDAKHDIVCTGHLPELTDVVEHLRIGDVFVLPSLWDGLPNSLLEAMAVGLPVIASDAGAIGEVVRDGENGILIPRTHLHQMADRIEHFLSKPAVERQTMVNNARQSVEKHYSSLLERERLGQLLKLVLQGQRDGTSDRTDSNSQD